MNTTLNKNLKILSILPYKFSEDFFKEKIGSGDYLNQLKELSILNVDDDGITINQNSEEIKKIIKSNRDNEIIEMHKNLINYYTNRISKYRFEDFNEFLQQSDECIHLSYHLRELKEFDKSIEYLFIIGKKMVFWGFSAEFLDKLEQFEDDTLSNQNHLLKCYYLLFAKIISVPQNELDLTSVNKLFETLENSVDINSNLFFEFKILKGIFTRFYKKSVDSALNIFNDLEKNCETRLNSNDETINIIYSKILQNIAMIYSEKSCFDECIKKFKIAEQYLEKCDDLYEYTKFNLNKLIVLSANDTDNPECFICREHIDASIENSLFPDLERSYFNLISDFDYHKLDAINNYFELKSYVLLIDLRLFYGCFVADFIDLLKKIKPILKKENKEDVIIGLNTISEVLEEASCFDEQFFINALQALLMKNDTNEIVKKIKNPTLIKIFEKYTKDLE